MWNLDFSNHLGEQKLVLKTRELQKIEGKFLVTFFFPREHLNNREVRKIGDSKKYRRLVMRVDGYSYTIFCMRCLIKSCFVPAIAFVFPSSEELV